MVNLSEKYFLTTNGLNFGFTSGHFLAHDQGQELPQAVPERSAVRSGHAIAMNMLRETAEDAPNRAGKVFTSNEFKKLLMSVWVVAMADKISLVDWILLLGALRAEQFDRFRAQGMQSITFYRETRDDAGFVHPIRSKRVLIFIVATLNIDRILFKNAFQRKNPGAKSFFMT